jgi:hypothetical protein
MTMKKLSQLVVCFAVAASAAACIGFERKNTVTGPSTTGVGSLMGSWSSTNIIPTPSSCTDFKWNVTEQTGNTAKGSFSATCANDLKVTGTAQGTLNSNGSLQWGVEGNASAPGLGSCKITLTGTAEVGVSTVRVPYSGDTCLGKVSGVETLKR